MIKFLDLNKQYLSISEEIDAAIADVISRSAFVGGKTIERFENEFAEFCKVRHCVGVGNGTDAIEIALEALDMPAGSEVIVPANSFIASSEAVTRQGHKVVFADVCSQSYVLSIDDVRARVNKNTRAIVAVHLYGHPCDMDSLIAICKEFDLYLIEDCAQAHGAEYRGVKVGSIGDIATFSFYPGKNLGAYGDGGAITTNEDALALRCRMIANHGRVAKYDHEFEGRNSRLDGLQAAILSVKLKHLPGWLDTRIEIAGAYQRLLAGQGDLVLPVVQDWAKHVYHLYVIRSQARDQLKEHLATAEIQTGVHYPRALPKLTAYAYTGQANETMFANSSDSSLLSLPVGEHLGIADIDVVAAAIERFFDQR